MLAQRRGDHDRHHPAAEVEGDLIHLGIVGDGDVLMNLLMLENGVVENVLQSRLEVTFRNASCNTPSSSLRTTSQCCSRMTWSIVSVPVLSVHRTSIAPRFWIELSRLTITFLRDIRMAPLERQT